jgi:hypothetical protein
MRGLYLIGLMVSVIAACSPSPKARHQLVTEEVLRRTGVSDFVDASTSAYAAVRHEPSGMECVLPRDGTLDLGLFPAAAANPGAYCTIVQDRVASSFVVVKFDEQASLDQAFAEAVQTTVGGAQPTPWQGPVSAADRGPPEGLPHFRIARLQAQVDGASSYVRVAVSEARDWYLQQVVVAPLDQAPAVEETAGQTWRAALAAFVERED